MGLGNNWGWLALGFVVGAGLSRIAFNLIMYRKENGRWN